ncbi:MAG: hypothetical protein AB7U83_01675 [Vicinamibacterales bacterium]
MSWYALGAIGALVSVASLVTAFVWLAVRDEFRSRAMSEGEASRFAARGGGISRNVGARYLGPSRGTEVTAHIGRDELRRLVVERRWREAAPWLLLVLGVVLAFPFWPFFLLQLVGAPAWLAGIAAAIAALVVYRTLAPTYLA